MPELPDARPAHPANASSHLIGGELRPRVGSFPQGGPRARPGAGSEELRAIAAEHLAGQNGASAVRVEGAAYVNPKPDVLEAPVEGELVLLDPTAGTYFGLNESAATIWALLRDGRSIAEAAGSLSASFDVEPERARADVERLVRRLQAADLVSPGPHAAVPDGQV